MDLHMKNQDNIVGEESAQLLWCIDSQPMVFSLIKLGLA